MPLPETFLHVASCPHADIQHHHHSQQDILWKKLEKLRTPQAIVNSIKQGILSIETTVSTSPSLLSPDETHSSTDSILDTISVHSLDSGSITHDCHSTSLSPIYLSFSSATSPSITLHSKDDGSVDSLNDLVSAAHMEQFYVIGGDNFLRGRISNYGERYFTNLECVGARELISGCGCLIWLLLCYTTATHYGSSAAALLMEGRRRNPINFGSMLFRRKCPRRTKTFIPIHSLCHIRSHVSSQFP